ncbi:MAG: beta-lactamase family protein, partial [Gemmatimonadetes bacterium]|nr:beta-lactamase family protein [Gemmatimonadota bacterium]
MSVTRFLTLVSVLAAAPAVAAGQSAPPIPAAKVDAVFKDFGPTTPGCALGVYRNGAVAYAKGYGMADLSLGVPISPRTMFDIGSTSKQFAAAAVALLALDGKLQLSDDVRKYVPELPSYGAPITIDHMLRHTSGLRDYNGLLYLAGHRFEDFTDDDDALAVIVAQRNLNFAPGSRWDYSNTGFFLLSTIVKRVSGLTLAQFARERIFSPLGMTRTHFRDDHTEIVKDRATAYSPGAKGGYVIDMSNWDQTGDGAVNTNVLELARWDANFANPRVGGRDFVTMLETRGQLNNGDTLQYARGLFVDRYRGLRRVHHGGAWAGYRAMLMRFPDQGVSIAVTCNVADG